MTNFDYVIQDPFDGPLQGLSNFFAVSNGVSNSFLSSQNRWLLVELISCNNQVPSSTGPELLSRHVSQALRESVVKNFGEVGWGAVASSMTSKRLIISKD